MEFRALSCATGPCLVCDAWLLKLRPKRHKPTQVEESVRDPSFHSFAKGRPWMKTVVLGVNHMRYRHHIAAELSPDEH